MVGLCFSEGEYEWQGKEAWVYDLTGWQVLRRCPRTQLFEKIVVGKLCKTCFLGHAFVPGFRGPDLFKSVVCAGICQSDSYLS